MLHVFTAQLAAVLETRKLQVEAAAAQSMAETDRLRTALLTAVSHDLRTPLAGIKASVTSLLETDVRWSEEEVDDFLEAILSETERLNDMVGKLLDASRIQTGAVHVFFQVVGLDEVVASAIAGPARGGVSPRDRRTRVAAQRSDRPGAPGAGRSQSGGERPHLVARRRARPGHGGRGGGPGGPSDLRSGSGHPGDRSGAGCSNRSSGSATAPMVPASGSGLPSPRGLVEAMGHELIVEDTPGGGTTMVVGIKAAR